MLVRYFKVLAFYALRCGLSFSVPANSARSSNRYFTRDTYLSHTRNILVICRPTLFCNQCTLRIMYCQSLASGWPFVRIRVTKRQTLGPYPTPMLLQFLVTPRGTSLTGTSLHVGLFIAKKNLSRDVGCSELQESKKGQKLVTKDGTTEKSCIREQKP